MVDRTPPPRLCGCNMTVPYRSWRLIVWPESAPVDWLDRLKSHYVPFAVSPLHEPDPESVLEDERKPHYHVVFFFEGKKSFKQIDAYAQEVNAPMPLPSDSPRGAVRYFIHCDHPEKTQYPISSIQTFFGAEIQQYFELSFYQEVHDSKALFNYISEFHFTEYRALIDDLISKGLDEFYIMATRKMTIAVKAYLSSARYSDDWT